MNTTLWGTFTLTSSSAPTSEIAPRVFVTYKDKKSTQEQPFRNVHMYIVYILKKYSGAEITEDTAKWVI